MKEFKFRVGVKPTQDTIDTYNRCVTEILIDKYGIDVMIEVYKLEQRLKEEKIIQDNNN